MWWTIGFGVTILLLLVTQIAVKLVKRCIDKRKDVIRLEMNPSIQQDDSKERGNKKDQEEKLLLNNEPRPIFIDDLVYK